MQKQFFLLKVFIFILLAQPVYSQCTITSCTNPTILSGIANWVDGVEGSTNGTLSISGITLGNIDCLDGGAGIEIYVYQLLPDGTRTALCDVANGAPDNFVFKYSFGIGPASDCSDAAIALPDVQLYDHEIVGNENSTMYLCEGGMYEVVMVAYVADDGQPLPDEQAVFSALNPDQYIELNLGTFFVNYTNEFAQPNPFPIPITTAVITGPNGETETMTANCSEEVSLFFEGLSYIGRCRFDEESVPNFYPFCDPSDPTMMNETYSPSITSETENFVFYTVNGGAPVIIRNGNGGDPATDAYGGQETGPGNLPGLGANECYTGICGSRSIPAPDSICDGDVIVVTLQTLDVYSGITVEDQITITYSGEGCNMCEPTCPAEASISSDVSDVCSGESISITGTTTGEGIATFTIIESTGEIAEINDGAAFTLPENTSCSPITYTFNATATCDDDGSEITNGTFSIEVTVYPVDISAFVATNDGECSTNVTIDSSCGTNISISPSDSQMANADETGIHNYTASWTGGGPSCVSEVNLTANYNCPPDIVCPSSADIAISSDQICSGESVTINGTASGEGTGIFTITESTGTITGISNGTAFALPENNTCEVITYTFTATAVCDDDGSTISDGNLSTTVTVYPTDISAFVTVNDGECSTGITLDTSCGTNISISPSDSQSANAGETGTHNYIASWAGGGPSCDSDVNLTANYNCPPDIVCPTAANISASLSEVCSGESITISGAIEGEGSASFTIIESSGAISGITEGIAFSMPENNTCSSITYTFNATAICLDDNSEITNGSLSLDVTVYPSNINAFVIAEDSECSTTVTIDESCAGNISISPSESQTANSGESGIHNYTASWIGGGPNCITNLPLMPAYNCITCPTEASISVSETEVCSGESVTITGTATGDGSANFEITDESGSITEITKGVVFNMPANITCAPVTYTFTAVAICEDDGSEISGSALSVDVIVYPTQIANFLSISEGDCSTNAIIDASCAANVSVSPSESQSTNPDESGTHEYIFSWIGGGPNCVSDETLLGNYDCPSDIVCPAEANISVSETEICSGEMITINAETTGVGGATFSITESSGTITTISESVSFALPENNTCSPITYTFNATATCNDDNSEITNGNLNLDVTVYPADISSFVSSNDGVCSTSVTVDASCGTNISISPSENQMANPDESGTHNYTVSWAGGSSCISDINLAADYNCPTDVEELGTISGFVGEDVDNDDIPDQPIEGVTIELYDIYGALLIATTTNPNGNYIFTDLPAGDYVVNEIQPTSFENVTEGDTTPDTSDSTNAPDAPLDNQLSVTLTPGEIDDGNDFVEELLGSISGNVGEDIDNNDTADQPIPGVTINLFNSSGQLLATTTTDSNGDYIFPELPAGDYVVEEIQPPLYSDVSEGNPFPSPNPPTFVLDNLIPVTLSPGEISTDNNFVEELLGSISGNVGEDVNNDDLPEIPIVGVTIYLLDTFGNLLSTTLTDNAGDYEFTNLPTGTYVISEDQPSNSNGDIYIDVTEGDAIEDDFVNDQTPYPDTLLDNELTVTLNPGETDAGNNFVDELPAAACPTEASINASVSELCSSGSIIISGSIVGEGEASFTIVENSGIITNITEGENIDLPENVTCNPVIYTFNATATCFDDGSEIVNGTLSAEVTVYPSDISAFVTSNGGECSTSISIDASCGNNISVTPALSQTANPGESGTHNYTANWTGGGPACIASQMLTANYNCPEEIVCPTSANIVINTNEICSGETVVILGEYEGGGAAIYTITETSGAISGIESGVALTLPENTTCGPETYIFELAMATCVADGSTIPVNQSTIEITVYPSDIGSFISTVENNCLTTVNIASICEDLVFVFPAGGQSAQPGSEAGTHTYAISWNGGSNCEMTTEISLNYTCDCVFDPALAEIELVNGSTNVCFGGEIEYNAKYDDEVRDLAVEGGVDESYNAAFIIFIEPIDFNQPTESENIYRITNDTILKNDDTIEPGTYYIYYFQGLDVNDPINEDDLCLLYSQDFLVVEILPAVNSGEAVCTGVDNSNEVTISVADFNPDSLPYDAYVESNGIQYAYNSIEVVDSIKILNFTNLPDGYYFFYYEDAQNCTTELQLEFSCESQTDAEGCTDPCAENYDPNATVSDGSCEPYDATCNEDCSIGDLSVWDEMSCSCVTAETIEGCLDAEACNYNANANCEDGSCVYSNLACVEPCNAPICADDEIFNSSLCECVSDTGCTDPCAPNYNPDAPQDGTCLPYDTTCNDDCTLGDITVFDYSVCSCVVSVTTVFGCTDSNACNYDPVANCDDGSCVNVVCNSDGCEGDIEIIDPNDACVCVVLEVQNVGCDDPEATNYDATVNCSDISSCVYDCTPPTPGNFECDE